MFTFGVTFSYIQIKLCGSKSSTNIAPNSSSDFFDIINSDITETKESVNLSSPLKFQDVIAEETISRENAASQQQ